MQKQLLNNRISWIDMAKGYGILLVIYAHLGTGALHTWIYTFHMPLFFFLSGYVFSTRYDFKEFIKRKCKAIVIPYFCLGIPMIFFQLLKYLIHGKFSVESMLNLLKEFFLQQRLWTLWFIACLFCLNVLFYLLIKLCKSEYGLVIGSFVLAIIGLTYYSCGGQPLAWNIDVCFTAAPIFALGYIYKNHTKHVDAILMKKKIAVVAFVIFGLVNLVCGYLSLDETGIGLEMFDSKYGNSIYTYIAAFAGIFCIVILSKCLTFEPIRYIGENSMIYYAWHQTIMMPIMTVLMKVLGLDVLCTYGVLGNVVYKLICMIGIIVTLTICNWGIKKLGLQWILGKRREATKTKSTIDDVFGI